MEEKVGEALAGFPSLTESWRERPLQLQELIVRDPDTTYYFRVRGQSMRDAGIIEADVLVVDRAVEAISGDIVVVTCGDRRLVKRLEYVGEGDRQMLLCSAHPAYPPLLVTSAMQVEIWGVVIAVVRRMRRRRSVSRQQQREP